MHRTPMKDPTEDFSRRIAWILGIVVLLSLFFNACAQRAGPAVSLGGDTLETNPPETIVWTVKNDNSRAVTVKIQRRARCGAPRSYRASMRQVESYTSHTDTLRATEFTHGRYCGLVDVHAGKKAVPPQLRGFGLYSGAHVYITVANDVTHTSLWIR